MDAVGAVLAGAGQYSPPEWLPLRSPARVGCVRTNCIGDDGKPYHGYWAVDFLDPDRIVGDPVYAAGAGQVHITSRSNVCGGSGTPGNSLTVDHGGGVVSYYTHLDSSSRTGATTVF